MGQFRNHHSDPTYLLPQRIGDLIPDDDISWTILEIADKININGIRCRYSTIGSEAFHPRLLLKLIFYGVATGNRSSRKIARLAQKDLGGIMLSGGEKPSWRTVARFIADNQNQVRELFMEVLTLCRSLNMVSFGHISLDGTKINGVGPKSGNLKFKGIQKEMARLNEEIKKAIEEIKTNDVQETEQWGEKSGDEVPEEIKNKQQRLERLNKALEDIKKRAHDEKRELKANDCTNPVDPDSRLMKTRKNGFQQGYNHQIAVDHEALVIVAYDTCQDTSDIHQLQPMVEQCETNTGEKIEKFSSDMGYFSGENLLYLENKSIDGYVCPEQKVGAYHKEKFIYDAEQDLYICPAQRRLSFKEKKKKKTKQIRIYSGDCSGCPHQSNCTKSKSGNRQIERDIYEPQRDAMRAKFQSEAGKAVFKLRKQTVEPVFGQIKQQLNFVQHHYRGLSSAGNEFGLACLVHNLKRIWHQFGNVQELREALKALP
jgi:transposase/uncharacterized protein YukE